jgi:hypothetical protein
MSMKGIQTFAKALSVMQESRIELLGGDPVDMRLSQLLEDAKESVKDKFCGLTLTIEENEPK